MRRVALVFTRKAVGLRGGVTRAAATSYPVRCSRYHTSSRKGDMMPPSLEGDLEEEEAQAQAAAAAAERKPQESKADLLERDLYHRRALWEYLPQPSWDTRSEAQKEKDWEAVIKFAKRRRVDASARDLETRNKLYLKWQAVNELPPLLREAALVVDDEYTPDVWYRMPMPDYPAVSQQEWEERFGKIEPIWNEQAGVYTQPLRLHGDTADVLLSKENEKPPGPYPSNELDILYKDLYRDEYLEGISSLGDPFEMLKEDAEPILPHKDKLTRIKSARPEDPIERVRAMRNEDILVGPEDRLLDFSQTHWSWSTPSVDEIVKMNISGQEKIDLLYKRFDAVQGYLDRERLVYKAGNKAEPEVDWEFEAEFIDPEMELSPGMMQRELEAEEVLPKRYKRFPRASSDAAEEDEDDDGEGEAPAPLEGEETPEKAEKKDKAATATPAAAGATGTTAAAAPAAAAETEETEAPEKNFWEQEIITKTDKKTKVVASKVKNVDDYDDVYENEEQSQAAGPDIKNIIGFDTDARLEYAFERPQEFYSTSKTIVDDPGWLEYAWKTHDEKQYLLRQLERKRSPTRPNSYDYERSLMSMSAEDIMRQMQFGYLDQSEAEKEHYHLVIERGAQISKEILGETDQGLSASKDDWEQTNDSKGLVDLESALEDELEQIGRAGDSGLRELDADEQSRAELWHMARQLEYEYSVLTVREAMVMSEGELERMAVLSAIAHYGVTEKLKSLKANLKKKYNKEIKYRMKMYGVEMAEEREDAEDLLLKYPTKTNIDQAKLAYEYGKKHKDWKMNLAEEAKKRVGTPMSGEYRREKERQMHINTWTEERRNQSEQYNILQRKVKPKSIRKGKLSNVASAFAQSYH